MIDFRDIPSLRSSIQDWDEKQKKSVIQGNDIIVLDDIRTLNLPYTPQRVNMTIFGICVEGKAQVSIDSRQLELAQDCYLVTFPSQILQLHELTADFRAYFICLSADKGQQIMNRVQDVVTLFMYIRQHPCAQLDSNTMTWITNLHQMLFDEMHSADNIFSRQTTESLLIALYYKTCNVFGRQLAATPIRSSRQEDIFVQFIHELEQHYKVHREVSYYAEQMCVTPKYLSTVVKNVSGRSAGQCIDSYVIEEAKALLRTTRLSIQEVSQQLNFPNQSFFGKYFKRLTNMSPFQYRKEQVSIKK